MSVVEIPGLNVCPAEATDGEGIELKGFTKSFTVPEVHRYGNSISIFNFEKLDKIEEGSFGALYKCRNKITGEIYSLKKFKIPSTENGIPASIPKEILMLKKLKHTNILNSHGLVAGRNLLSNYLLLDYCAFSLNNLIEKKVEPVFQKPVLKNIMKQLLSGIHHIHGAMIIHRDICCNNIRISSTGIVKITGFQTAKYFKPGDLSSKSDICNIKYCAPEILLHAELCTPAVDMWSTGCIFARLLLRDHLFNGESEVDVLTNIFNVLGTPTERIWPGFEPIKSKFCQENKFVIENIKEYSELGSYFKDHTLTTLDVVQKLLVYYFNSRISAQLCLKHPYFLESPRACGVEDLACILQSVDKSNMMQH